MGELGDEDGDSCSWGAGVGFEKEGVWEDIVEVRGWKSVAVDGGYF